VSTKTFQFEQKGLRVKVGETAAFRLDNADAAAHCATSRMGGREAAHSIPFTASAQTRHPTEQPE